MFLKTQLSKTEELPPAWFKRGRAPLAGRMTPPRQTSPAQPIQYKEAMDRAHAAADAMDDAA